jgi:hypothetical protein
MKNAVFYLIGPPGVGKYTVGKIIAERTSAKLVDNHYSINPIFGLIEQDGRTPLPAEIWPLVGRVRSAVLETIATWSPRDWNFVFTHAASDDPSDPEELARRVLSPERRLRMKESDPEAARANAVAPVFDPGHANVIDIDTTTKAPGEVADTVIEAAGKLWR